MRNLILALTSATLGVMAFAIAWWLGIVVFGVVLFAASFWQPVFHVLHLCLRWWRAPSGSDELRAEFIVLGILITSFGCIWFLGLTGVYIAGWPLADPRVWLPFLLSPLLATGVWARRNPARGLAMALLATAVGGAWACTAIIGNADSLFWPMLGYVAGGGVICVIAGLLRLPRWLEIKND